MRVRYTTNYRSRGEWHLEVVDMDGETLESWMQGIIALGWIPKAIDSAPIGRKARFEDDEGYELIVVVMNSV